jgi:hypothetical protein
MAPNGPGCSDPDRTRQPPYGHERLVGVDWLGVAIEEYRSLRAEALASIDRQQRVLASGTATAGLLLGLGADAKPGSTVAVVLLLVLEPLLAWLVTAMWLGEVERMVRAGAFLSVLERKIAAHFPEQQPPLEWESRLRREAPGGRRILWVYRAVFGVMTAIAAAAVAIGATQVIGRHPVRGTIATSCLVAALIALVVFYVASEYRMRGLGGKRFDRIPWLLRAFGAAADNRAAATSGAQNLLAAMPAQRGPDTD